MRLRFLSGSSGDIFMKYPFSKAYFLKPVAFIIHTGPLYIYPDSTYEGIESLQHLKKDVCFVRYADPAVIQSGRTIR